MSRKNRQSLPVGSKSNRLWRCRFVTAPIGTKKLFIYRTEQNTRNPINRTRIRLHLPRLWMETNRHLLLCRRKTVITCLRIYGNHCALSMPTSMSEMIRWAFIAEAARMPSFRNVHPCTFCNFEFFIGKTRYCLKPWTSCQYSDVHGCTTVADGSNGLTVSIFSRFLSTLPDAFTLFSEKCAKFYFLKMQQLNKIWIFETAALVRVRRTHQYAGFRKKTWRLRWAASL